MITIDALHQLKAKGEKFCCIAAYDAAFARLIAAAGIEVVLVGDSLGMVLQGRDSTLPVSIDEMAYHTRCAARGNAAAETPALVMGDMPFMSYGAPEQALQSAAALMRAGAHCVKMEGGAWLCESIRQLVERGVPVCAHLGLTPQSINVFSGFRVQGREAASAERMLKDAAAVEEAGASLLLLECIPAPLAAELSRKAGVPVIGIGAGPGADAQVLVLHDMLGLNERPPRFVEDFLSGQPGGIPAALRAFRDAVKSGAFPAPRHCYE